MKFALITYILHKYCENRHFSYGPYVREMNIWFKNTSKNFIVAPEIPDLPKKNEVAYETDEIVFEKIPSVSLLSPKEVILTGIYFPFIAFKIFKVMLQSDHLHLRCPGNVGLIACFVQILFPWKQKSAKYAGNWDPEAEQPWTYKLQKWILGNTFLTRNMKVLVYGEWPNQSKNIKPFFTASFSEKEISEVPIKQFNPPYLFLFVGSLVSGKRPLLAIKIVEELKRRNFPVRMEIYGEGILQEKLEKYVQKSGLSEIVRFQGNQPLEIVKKAYKKAHFLILPSKSEGWPKAVAEAMFFGCIPVATAVSCVPWMLGRGRLPIAIGTEGGAERGILITESGKRMERREKSREQRGGNNSSENKIVEEAVKKIITLINNPSEIQRKSVLAKEWSQQYTLERFRKGIQVVLDAEKR